MITCTKKQRGIPEIYLPTNDELRRMSMSLLQVETLNWQETDLGVDQCSDDEEHGEYEFTGLWRVESAWKSPGEEWEFNGEWELGPEEDDFEEDEVVVHEHVVEEWQTEVVHKRKGGEVEDEEEEEDGDEQTEILPGEEDHDLKKMLAGEDGNEEEEEDGEEEEEQGDGQQERRETGKIAKKENFELPEELIVVTKNESCEGNLESFSGKSLKELKKNRYNRGATVKKQQGLPPIKAKLDSEPMEGIERPRFIWETQSETALGQENREIKVIHFDDNSVVESVFRIWRRTAQGGAAALELADVEEEDLEDLLSLEVLEAIRPGFSKGALTMEKYKAVVMKALGLPSLSLFPNTLAQLFIKIDTFGVGKISWDDLCDFMQQKYAEKTETEYSSPPVDLVPPCHPFETPHRAPITRALTLPDRGLLTFSEDGIVGLWTTSFKARIWRALGRPAGLKAAQNVVDKKTNKWYTDIVLLQKIGKYVVVTGEKELQFYDTSTYDPYCQISNLHSVPIHIDAKLTASGLIVAMGDMNGVLCILVIDEAVSALRAFSQERRINNIPTLKVENAVRVPGVRYIKYKVHADMISHVLYVNCMNRIITSAMDVKHSLAMGKIFESKNATELMEDLTSGYQEGITDLHNEPKLRRRVDEAHFPISKGCRSFDVWEDRRWIAAGGLDRLVWVWNLYVPSQPIAKLRGHNAAIFRVVFDTRSETVFSFCTEKTIRIWNLYTNTCMHVFDSKLTKLRGPIIYSFFPTTDAIFVQTSVEACFIKLKRQGDDSLGEGQTHRDAIRSVMYNPQHEYFMTCSSEDILVWECQTGHLTAEFNTIGGDGSMHLDTIASKLQKTMEEESRFIMPVTLSRGREQVDTYDVGPVTAVALDNFGRRFFTSHTNGVIKAWNFYNGRNLYNLYKPLNNVDICDMHYITINEEHRYLVTVGWDRRVVIHIDSQGPEVVHKVHIPAEPIMFSNKELNHKDDVWAVGFGFPNMIASGDYSGKLLVWNINSGHIVANLIANQCRDRKAEKDSFITSLVFHHRKIRDTKNTYLLSAGPYHLIHIWRANTTRELNVGSVGWNRPCEDTEDFVTCIREHKANNIVVTSDSWGCVSVWEINDMLGESEPTEWFPKGYTRNGRNKLFTMKGEGDTFEKKDQGYGKGPVQLRLIRSWKAHVDGFAALEVCETYGLVITGGKDCSVRIWDMLGRHLGILGSGRYWLVGDPESYVINAPRDVQLDIRRIRAMEIFRHDVPERLEVEEIAEEKARLLMEKKKKELLPDSEIWERALQYERLIPLDIKTMVWLRPDAPVGPHRRLEPLKNKELLEINYQTGRPKRLKVTFD